MNEPIELLAGWEPENSYWLRKKDGLLYSSAEDRFIFDNDTAYQAWKAQGNEPNSFPKNASGEESFLLLMDNLSGYGIGEINQVKAELAVIDSKYNLSPRFACDLAAGDEWVKSQWDKHEVEAAPLRIKLAELVKGHS